MLRIYQAMVILHEDECETLCSPGIELCEVPKGLYLVGDVVLNEFSEDGRVDIGLSMKNASQMLYEYMLELGDYELDFNGRTFLEEHIFQKEWFVADQPESIQADINFGCRFGKNSVDYYAA